LSPGIFSCFPRYQKNRSLVLTQLGCFADNNPGFVLAQAQE
jgi:hypothetical protein